MSAYDTWFWQQWHIWTVGALIAVVAFSFIAHFVRPSLRLGQTLARAIERLSALKANAPDGVVQPSDIEQQVMTDSRLAHLWAQYANGLHAQWGPGSDSASTVTLHEDRVKTLSESFFAAMRAKSSSAMVDLSNIEQHVQNDPQLSSLWREYAEALEQAGARTPTPTGRVKKWRASTLAESFFSEYALVDSPLKTDFYKHVPGILTGLGIIGTFAGLITGLIHFDVSDPQATQTQLNALVKTVGHAFFVSASAITLAMLFTWIEKAQLTARYAQAETLQHLIDSLFEVRTDEAYMERLVAAAEAQASASRAMLRELRQIVSTLDTRK